VTRPGRKTRHFMSMADDVARAISTSCKFATLPSLLVQLLPAVSVVTVCCVICILSTDSLSMANEVARS
jgi:hypothetical protein